MSPPFSTGDPVGWLLWTADHGLRGCDVQAEGPPAADDFPGPDEDPGWICTADALRCQGRWRKPKGRTVWLRVLSSAKDYLDGLMADWCHTGVPYPWCHSRGSPAHEGGSRWHHGDIEWSCQWSGNGGRNGGVHRRGHGKSECCW